MGGVSDSNHFCTDCCSCRCCIVHCCIVRCCSHCCSHCCIGRYCIGRCCSRCCSHCIGRCCNSNFHSGWLPPQRRTFYPLRPSSPPPAVSSCQCCKCRIPHQGGRTWSRHPRPGVCDVSRRSCRY